MKGRILGCDRFGCTQCSGRFGYCSGQVEPRYASMRNQFDSEGFAGFWLQIEQRRAEHDYLRNWGTGVFSRSHRKKEDF